jgi:site-specific DNA-methyltransferase (adenine-specific)
VDWKRSGQEPAGRFPANVIHDGSDEVLAEFAKYGAGGGGSFSKSGVRAERGNPVYGKPNTTRHSPDNYGDTGTAARFFYTAKASKDDRNDGLHDYEHTEAADMVDREPGSDGMNSPRAGAGRTSGAKNHHPTVKPTSLMRYLVRLVTPKGGLVLDPFAGSGTTLIAAYREDCRAIGIELDPDYFKMASHRIDKATAQLRLEL